LQAPAALPWKGLVSWRNRLFVYGETAFLFIERAAVANARI
jgi:hypothetical protein